MEFELMFTSKKQHQHNIAIFIGIALEIKINKCTWEQFFICLIKVFAVDKKLESLQISDSILNKIKTVSKTH